MASPPLLARWIARLIIADTTNGLMMNMKVPG
jgi:hypothetical protein